MSYDPKIIARLIEVVAQTIEANAEEVTALDQAIGDGDHVINLQRGLTALMVQRDELAELDWQKAWQKIGMILMSSIGGASGSLFGTLFVAMSKAASPQSPNLQAFATVFRSGVDAVKHRGKADAGEKTMLDVLIPVANYLEHAARNAIESSEVLQGVAEVAEAGMESTRAMLATKGRAAFLEERSRGHIDAGAKTSQLIICAIADCLSATPA